MLSYRFQSVLNNRVNLLVQNSVNRPKPDYRKRIKKKLDILTYFIFHSSWYNFYNIWHKDHSESCNLLWRLRMAHLIIKWAFSVSRYDMSFYYIKIKSKGSKATSLEKKTERVIFNQLKTWLIFKMCAKFTVSKFFLNQLWNYQIT